MNVSLSTLTTKIRKIVPDIISSGPVPKSKSAPIANIPQTLIEPVLSLVGPVIDAEYTRCALLMRGAQITGSCKKCLQVSKLRHAKVLGYGYNGTVFEYGPGRCIKVESLSTRLFPVTRSGKLLNQFEGSALEHLGNVAERMGELGIGPKVFSWRVCSCARAVMLVIEMERIEGRTLQDVVLDKATRALQMDKVRSALLKKLELMHANGFAHADFHPGNVMVDKRNVPFIIDFSFMIGEGADGTAKKDTAVMGRGMGAMFRKIVADNLAMAREMKIGNRQAPHNSGERIRLIVLAKLIEDGVIKITGTNEDSSMKFSRWGKI